MSRITNKHIIKIKELISDEVCMGTFGLVELELLEMEKDFSKQLQNTSSNSDYMMALNEILHNRLDCLEMVNVEKLIGLINEDIHRLNQRS